MNGSDIIKRLKADGWRVKRIRGSHHMMEKAGRVIRFPFTARPISAKVCWQKSSGKPALN